jgi:hypothetical protein
MRKLCTALLLMVPCLFAYGDCQEISGSFITNILNEAGTVTINGKTLTFINETLSATGDLAGAPGIYILKIGPGPNGSTQATVHHHWVTTAGDTLFLSEATGTFYQIGSFAGVLAVADNDYVVPILGGTGRFAGATGQIITIGVLDTVNGVAVGRYHGTICFKKQNQQ